MSLAAPADERRGDPAAIRALLRRRQSTEKLYWLLSRPRLRAYATAIASLLLRRVIVAICAAAALALTAFLGVVAGNIGYPTWPAVKKIDGLAIWRADTHAASQVSAWAPAFLFLGLVLACIPRSHRWLFRLTILAGAALGYYRRLIPAFPRSALALDIGRHAARLAGSIPPSAPPSSIGAAITPLFLVLGVAYVLYRCAYGTTKLTMRLIPRRRTSHLYSAFTTVNPVRRVAAVPVAGALLSFSLWTAEGIRASLPARVGQSLFLAHSAPSVTAWVVLAAGASMMICLPRPQGLQGLMILVLVAVTAYAFAPQVNLIGVPAWLPAAAGGFWMLIILYFVVAGLGFDLLAWLLDWPSS
jgi:hypothetical protein